MKLLGIFIIFAVAFGVYAGIENHSVTRLAEAKILAKIEKLRQKWIENGYDPYHFDECQYNLDGLGLSLDIKATGLIQGMLNFNISKFTFNIKVGGGYKFTFNMELPEITANFETYNLNGWYGVLPLFGNGAVQAKLNGLVYHGEGELNTINAEEGILLSLGKYSCGLEIKDADLQILGWLGNNEQSKMLTNLFNSNIKYILENNSTEINAKIQEKVLEWAEGKTIPLEDVIS